MAPLLLIGAAVGGAAMYFFDPNRGRRRRALLRDQALKAVGNARDTLDAGQRDFANRSRGVAAQARGWFTRPKLGDEVLVERVRAKIGRYVAHPGAIEVAANEGHVTLTGSILSHEHDDFLKALRSMPGVSGVTDDLAVHQTAEGIPELQGGRPRRGERIEFFQNNWAPAARLVAGVAGTSLALYALRMSGVGSLALGLAAAALVLRSTTNMSLRRLAGMAGPAIDVQKTITIDAPVDQVFEFLAKYEKFPRFMPNVRSVEQRADGQSHWTVAGPAGTTVEWDSITTALDLNELIAWRTTPESAVQHEGWIRLEPFESGTRVHLRMSYSPPGGAAGHVIAKLFGADPKSELDQALMRLKSVLEGGKMPRDAAVPD